MFKMTVALIAKEEGARPEVFPAVDSMGIHGFHAEGADTRTLDEWKKTVLHYAAMEQWAQVFFCETLEQCYLRGDNFPADQFPGSPQYAIFPYSHEEDLDSGTKA